MQGGCTLIQTLEHHIHKFSSCKWEWWLDLRNCFLEISTLRGLNFLYSYTGAMFPVLYSAVNVLYCRIIV